uniref:Caspase family p20 domain-containing protein n=1 Tax=Arion vulgaris TaxID=1028688 RepID=A0A0B6ZE65_9EUPU
MSTSNRNYRQLLALIDSELRVENIKSLKFLCDSSLGTKKTSFNFSSGSEIFDALEKNQKLNENKLLYLCELLHVIGRVDLATTVDPNYVFVSDWCRCADPFRVMLFKISEELASEDLRRLRFMYEKVPKSASIEDGMDLFWIMLQHNSLSSQKLSVLHKLLETIDRHDLADIVNNFNTVLDSQEYPDICRQINYTEVIPVLESMSVRDIDMSEQQNCEVTISVEEKPMDMFQIYGKKWSSDSVSSESNSVWSPDIVSSESSNVWSHLGNISPESCPPVWNQLSQFKTHNDENDNDTVNISVSMESAQAVGHMRSAAGEAVAGLNDVSPNSQISNDQSYVPLEYYKMTAKPRGYCVVIDNQQFKADPLDPEAVQTLGTREGSDIDSRALQKSFERLHFLVEVHLNQTDVNIIQLLRGFSAKDHKEFDCFICCILSHGGESHVFGVNGRKVQLGDITSMFRTQSCPSLSRKPKLFFMASCRGKTHQPSMQDIPSEPLFQSDKPEIDFNTSEWVPNEADFLFGYSTVVNHVSYRSKSQGTFYIDELTKVLDNYAHREELQQLLLRVNAAVTDRIYSRQEAAGHVVYKQTPAPQHTLRKLLKFR